MEQKNQRTNRLVMRIQQPTFHLELETFVDDDKITEKINALLKAIDGSKTVLEKTFGEIDTKVTRLPEEGKQVQHPLENLSEPYVSLAKRLNLPQEKIVGNNIFGFKDGKPQLFDPSKFKSANTATRALVCLFEIGVEKPSVPNSELSESYNMSKIKGRAISQIAQDMMKTGQLDSTKYKKSNDWSLTAKGLKDAENELKYLLSGD